MANKTSMPTKQVNALKRVTSKYNTKTAEIDSLRDEVDKAVLESRNAGGTFREIARISDRSIAWVQGSLHRSRN